MPLIILDRDGVINHDSANYIRSVDEWIPIEGSIEAISKLKKAGYHVAIATNQSGLARGYYTEATLQAMHAKLQDLLAQYDSHIEFIAYCPHQPKDTCECRKPAPGMLSAILQHFNESAEQAIMVGDSLTDYQAAAALNMPYVQVLTGKGERTIASQQLPSSVPIYPDLAAFVDAHLEHLRVMADFKN